MKIRDLLLATLTTGCALVIAAPANAQLPGETLPAWTHTASSCEVDEESAGRYTLSGADFTYLGGAEGGLVASQPPLTARCNVTNPLDSGNPSWDHLIVTYRDYDLSCTFNRVVVRLYRVPRVPGLSQLVATFNSDTVGGCSGFFFGSMTESNVAFTHKFDFLNNAYFVDIQLVRLDNEYPAPIARLVRLAHAD